MEVGFGLNWSWHVLIFLTLLALAPLAALAALFDVVNDIGIVSKQTSK